jgi:hypothetical protein
MAIERLIPGSSVPRFLASPQTIEGRFRFRAMPQIGRIPHSDDSEQVRGLRLRGVQDAHGVRGDTRSLHELREDRLGGYYP